MISNQPTVPPQPGRRGLHHSSSQQQAGPAVAVPAGGAPGGAQASTGQVRLLWATPGCSSTIWPARDGGPSNEDLPRWGGRPRQPAAPATGLRAGAGAELRAGRGDGPGRGRWRPGAPLLLNFVVSSIPEGCFVCRAEDDLADDDFGDDIEGLA